MRHNQNRRSRGRSRKGPNPLTRSYESNGPDVKVRGTAAHVAEKYMTLARDALAAGDNVSGENYLQHAEHYNRIVMAAQAQFQQQQPQQFREGGDDYDDDRQPNGRSRDRFDYNGDGRDAEGDDGIEAEADTEPRRSEGRAPRRNRQDMDRQDTERHDTGRQDTGRQDTGRQEARVRSDRDEQQQEAAADVGSEPQPGVEPAAASEEEPPAPPRRRRGRPPKAGKEAGAETQDAADTTKDGAAALAAFPE